MNNYKFVLMAGEHGSGEDYIIRSFIICSAHYIFFG